MKEEGGAAAANLMGLDGSQARRWSWPTVVTEEPARVRGPLPSMMDAANDCTLIRPPAHTQNVSISEWQARSGGWCGSRTGCLVRFGQCVDLFSRQHDADPGPQHTLERLAGHGRSAHRLLQLLDAAVRESIRAHPLADEILQLGC